MVVEGKKKHVFCDISAGSKTDKTKSRPNNGTSSFLVHKKEKTERNMTEGLNLTVQESLCHAGLEN